MVALFRFATVILVVCVMPEISPYRVNTQIFEPFLQDDIELNASDKEYIHNHRARSTSNHNGDGNVEMDLERDSRDTKYRLEKRNGDLINFLLGLPKDMLDAGR